MGLASVIDLLLGELMSSLPRALRRAVAFSNSIEVARGIRVRLWPLLLGLAVVLFPFDWLPAVWPAYAQVFDAVFATALSHEIGHAALFFLLSLLVLLSVPALRSRPALYFGLLLLVAVGQEAIQALARQELPTIYDGRDLLMDLTGIVAAYLVALAWRWLFL